MRKFAVSAPATGDMYLEKQGTRKHSEDPDSSLIPDLKQVPRLEIQVGRVREGKERAPLAGLQVEASHEGRRGSMQRRHEKVHLRSICDGHGPAKNRNKCTAHRTACTT